MYFNRHDICAAHYLFLMGYHEGQWSEKYKRLSKLLEYFKPSPLLRGVEDLCMNGKSIYTQLVKKENVPQASVPSNIAMINALFGGANQWDY